MSNPLPRNIAMGDAMIAILRERGVEMTARELADSLGEWEFTVKCGCRGKHDRPSWSRVTIVSCRPIGITSGGWPYVEHVVRRPVRTQDINATLNRLARQGVLTKLILDRYRSVVWTLAEQPESLENLEAMWQLPNDTTHISRKENS